MTCKPTEDSRARNREYQRKWYRAHRETQIARIRERNTKFRQSINALLAVLKSGPCVDCKHTYPPCAMDFDHVRGIKIESVSRLKSWSEKVVRAEIAKCDLVCAVCHRIRTEKRRLQNALL